MTQVLFVSHDRIAPEMAGPGIRYFELARTLSSTHSVTLAAPTGSHQIDGGPELVIFDPRHPATLRRLFAASRVVVAPPLAPRLLRGITGAHRAWIVDLYNPEPFEGLEHQKDLPRMERKVRDLARIDRVAFAARAGTAFVCASERQRDMWLGFLAAARRLDSDRHARDPELRTLIDVVPFGLPDAPPRSDGPAVLRGAVFPRDARILVWHGGIWDWLDPLTVIRAVALLRTADPRWVLAFTGTKRPSERADMSMSARSIALVHELGLEAEGAVFFREGWTPYEERAAPLLEADVGVSAHFPTLESRFAHRTRVLDYIWAGLPVVCTSGDEWSERIEAERLGVVVPPGDPGALAAAASSVVQRGRAAYAREMTTVAERFRWQRVSQPLIDLVERASAESSRRPTATAHAVGLRHSLASGAQSLRARVTRAANH